MPTSLKKLVLALSLALGTGGAGCRCFPVAQDLPRESSKITLPPYVIQAPDELIIDAVQLIPLPPYKIGSLDELIIQVKAPPRTPEFPRGKDLPEILGGPIDGFYKVEPGGTVNLGLAGSVSLVGQTLAEAKVTIEKHLRPPAQFLVTIALGQARDVLQQIKGPHLVRNDGTVGLGIYGNVFVDSLTIEEAKEAIEKHLSKYFLQPQISVDVSGFNSQVYYVITDGGGGGLGEQVIRLPLQGKETVMDAISEIKGLPPVASKRRIWVARPLLSDSEGDEILPVDWIGITQRGRTDTNYQILPGDRVYVQARPLITFDNFLARVISPIERVLAVTLLTNFTVRSLQGAGGTSGTGGTGVP